MPRKTKKDMNWRAHQAVDSAVHAKFLRRPSVCSSCGEGPKGKAVIVGHHHLGYAPQNWLRVQWLCHSCHGDAHRLGIKGTVRRYSVELSDHIYDMCGAVGKKQVLEILTEAFIPNTERRTA